MSVRMPDALTESTPSSQAEEMLSRVTPLPKSTTSPRMPNDPPIYNPDDRTMSFSDYKSTTDSRIDDSVVGYRTTWSSAKMQSAWQPTENERISRYVATYGELYFSEYDETVYNEWTQVVEDAESVIDEGYAFYVAWSDKRMAQVVNADSDAEPRMTVLIDGRSFIMTDTGISEVPLYNIVMQYQGVEEFPQVGTKDRLYIDTEENVMYYWNGTEYVSITGITRLHTLTFGADQAYVYDGTQDVTVPVYMGEAT